MDRPAVLDSGQAPYWTSGVLGVVAGTGALLSVLFPGVLEGEPALDGNLRGTALVVLVVVLPLLALAMVRTAHGSARWLVVWLAAVAHLLYQGFMFSFATPGSTTASCCTWRTSAWPSGRRLRCCCTCWWPVSARGWTRSCRYGSSLRARS